MRAHLNNGSPALGLRAYEHRRLALADELGSAPGPAVDAVYELLAITWLYRASREEYAMRPVSL
jgi:hypothetical protein